MNDGTTAKTLDSVVGTQADQPAHPYLLGADVCLEVRLGVERKHLVVSEAELLGWPRRGLRLLRALAKTRGLKASC